MLEKLQRPKWQHKNPELRQQAVDSLDPKNEEDNSILLSLAREDEAEAVRLAAIKKLTDLKILLQIANQAEAAESAAATEQLRSIFAGSGKFKIDINTMEQVLNMSKAQATPKEFALNAADQEVGIAALEKIQDENEFLEIAQSAKSIKVRLAAVDKITELELLRTLQKTSSDKSVLKVVRSQLKQVREQEVREQEVRAELEKICSSMENLVALPYEERYAKRLNNLMESLSVYDELIRGEFADRIQKVEEKSRESLELYRAEEDKKDAIESAKQKQKLVCDELTAFIAELKKNVSVFTQDKYDETLDQQKKLWEEVKGITQPDSKLLEKYYKSIEELENYRSAQQRYSECKPELDELCFSADGQTEYDELKTVTMKMLSVDKKIKWPNAYQKPELINRIHSNITEAEKLKSKIEKNNKSKANFIGKKLIVLQKEIGKKNLISANRLYNYIAKLIDELDEHFKAQELSRLARVEESLNELRDWHQFATQPKKEALCEKMESIIKAGSSAEEKAEQIKSLQQEWKELSSSNTDTDQALWERFKSLADKAFEPCLAFYAEKDKLRADNLKKRMGMCDKLETFYQKTDWSNVDWKKVETVERTARNEWFRYTPVPHKESKSIQKRFDQISKEIRSKLDEERDANLTLRKELSTKAEELAAKIVEITDDESLEQGIEKVFFLQKEWKNLGITYYKHDRKQWQRFRGACDKVFERRDQLRSEQRQKTQNELGRLDEIAQEIKALADQADDDMLKNKERYLELRKEYSRLTKTLPQRQVKQSMKSFNDASRLFDKKFKGIDGRKQARLRDSLQSAARICIDLEKAAQGGDKLDLSAVQTTFAKCLESLTSKMKTILQKRFDEALAAQDNGVLDQQLQDNQVTLEMLAIELEVISNTESPQEFKDQRMQFQLQRLQQGLQGRLSKEEQNNKTKELLEKWYRVGAVDISVREKLEQRLESVLRRL